MKNRDKEKEASLFAMELLMPTKFMVEDCKNLIFDVDDSKHVKKLSEKYQVSDQIMTLRLIQLGYSGEG